MLEESKELPVEEIPEVNEIATSEKKAKSDKLDIDLENKSEVESEVETEVELAGVWFPVLRHAKREWFDWEQQGMVLVLVRWLQEFHLKFHKLDLPDPQPEIQ